ncbi:response regulator [uncultured Kordia sp.]|uniref:response regulator n=1 Tax=uncultured Kordia sp. TaxID=507699 RepID=UPI002624CF2D|nr:response regulator [uncultured Kordia sp.]
MQLKILYVEDNKVNAMVMDRMLSQNGSNIIIAENGKEAIDIAQKNELDLILLDINLGKNQMDGCQVLKKLQELQVVKTTPVFAVTAYAMPGDEKHFKNIGFDQYFSKPIDFPQLRSEIDKLKL